jgi:hypothetical protein
VASKRFDRDHCPIFAQINALSLVYRYTEALAGGRAPGLGLEEIVKKRSQKSIPISKASVWLKDGNPRVCSSVAIRSMRRRKDSLSAPPDMAQ